MAIDVSLILFDLNAKAAGIPRGSEIVLILQIGPGLPQDIYLLADDIPVEAGRIHLNQVDAECAKVRDALVVRRRQQREDPRELVALQDQFATAMFRWALQDGNLLTVISAQAQGDKRLRICTPYASARLRRFPFELMEPLADMLPLLPWIPRTPLAVSAGWSLVRSLPMGFRDLAPAEIRTLNVLVVGQESPERLELPAIDVRREMEAVQACLGQLANVRVIPLEINPSLEQIRDCVNEYEVHCIHVIGHGCEEIPGRRMPGLVFHSPDGQGQYVECDRLLTAILPQDGRNAPRLVFLNACHTEGFSSELLRRGIPAVVATQFQVGDWHSRIFAESFYRTLVREGDIEAAVLSGRQSLYLQNSVQWASYALYLQSSHGRLFHPERTEDLEWVRVPAGVYRSGSDRNRMMALLNQFGMTEEGNLDRLVEPIREQQVGEFWITKYPITNKAYERFVMEQPQWAPSMNWPYSPSKAKHPVNYVSVEAAQAFAAWLGAALPSAVQWEKAARGVQDLRCYPWGDQFDAQCCNCAERHATGTSEVDQHPRGDSPYGVSDMVGNVMEWLGQRNENGFVGCKGGAFDMTCEIYGLIHFTVWAQGGIADDDTGFRLVCERNPNELPRKFHHVVIDEN